MKQHLLAKKLFFKRLLVTMAKEIMQIRRSWVKNMTNRYAPEDIVAILQNSKNNAAYYIYQYGEVGGKYFSIVREIQWMLDALQGIHEINGSFYFAITASASPFQITQPVPNVFVILVAHRAAYFLMTLCFRGQSLSPLAQYLDVPVIEEPKDYSKKYLLDITKDIVFHTGDVSFLTSQRSTLVVYQAALLFIIAHEVAHAAHGHIEFIASPSFAEFSGTAEDRDLTMRALEMDSDSSATTSVFAVFERLCEMHMEKMDFSIGQSAEEFVSFTRRQYVVGIIFAHLYLDTLTSNHFPSKHPIGYARFLTSTEIINILFKRHALSGINFPEEVRQNLVSAFVRLSGDIKFLGHPIASNCMVWGDEDEPKYLYNNVGVFAGLDHLNLLHRRWSRLRAYLLPFRRGGVLAPATADPF